MDLYQKWCLRKAKIKENRLLKFYSKDESILDVGSGNCSLNLLLKKAGVSVVPLDIKNKSAFIEIDPVVYDGKKFPFSNNAFDTVQFITVLHHTREPEQLIDEAMRVGNKIIIMEDIYKNQLQKYLTYIADSINNWEFKGHPHTNKSDREWKAVFRKKNLKLEKVEYYSFLLFFKQVTYIVVKPA